MDNSSSKKLKSDLAIVGGGLTGCVLALLADKKKYDNIKIYEISKKLGGVLKDLEFNKDIFFNGCQYIDTSSDWFNKIRKKKIFSNQFKVFNCKYGSLTDYENKEIYSKDFPEPVFHKSYKNILLIKNCNIFNMQ